jgi:beta-galactosidase
VLIPENPLIDGPFADFDHFKLQKEAGLDFSTWDSYPLGNTEQFDWIDDETKIKYARQGRPDAQAWHHELYKSVAGYAHNKTAGTFGIME